MTAVLSMEVQFICPTDVVAANFTPFTPKILESKVKVQYPARIVSISRSGLVEVKFYLPVAAPRLTPATNESTADGERQLLHNETLLTPE